VGLAFGGSIRHEFVSYDDNDYVYENPHITAGLSPKGILWAFTHVHAANWHPLTTISHMLDCQLYGLNPWGHHLTNVLLHATAAILLFLALQKLTRSIWPSAFVAALFAIHPLRVESVAWISERKDLLSGVLFMLTLLAYARYVRMTQQFGWGAARRAYLMVVIFFALGLMSKPTLVTLPFVLLLLDYWPLQRWQASSRSQRSPDTGHKPVVRGLVMEKIPLFILSAASSVVTVLAQQKVIESNLQMNFVQRTANALISYVAYMGEMIWPLRLSVSHPYAEGYHNIPLAIASLILLLGTSALCLGLRKTYPFLLTGWLWYVGVLIPMIGLVQVSSQALADRYTYLSQIGLYIMLAWGTAALVRKWRWPRSAAAAPAFIVIIALAARSYAQTYYWRDSETLWRHALETNNSDYIAHDNLGYVLLQKGQIDDAITEDRKAIDLKPTYANAQNNLGNALFQKGRRTEAVEHYKKALALEPDFPEPHNNLANALFKEGQIDEAIEQYKRAVTLRPQIAELHYNLGSAYVVKGDWDDAVTQLEAALRIDNNYPEAHNKLGIALGATGKTTEAIGQFREALRLHHLYPQAHFNLGYTLVHMGQREEGIAHLMEAVRLQPDYTEAKEQLRELGVAPP
jgi:tetratricopeptide (TPR) repeat protein